MNIFKDIFSKPKVSPPPDERQRNTPLDNYTSQYNRQTIIPPQYDGRTLGIDIDDEVEKLKNFFRGRRLNAKGDKYVYFPGATKIVSEGGAEWLLSHHEIMLSLANATTNITENNLILALCEEYADNLLECVLGEEEEWEINAGFFDMIIDTLTRRYQLFLLKSLYDKQRKYMHGQHSEPVPEQRAFTA